MSNANISKREIAQGESCELTDLSIRIYFLHTVALLNTPPSLLILSNTPKPPYDFSTAGGVHLYSLTAQKTVKNSK